MQFDQRSINPDLWKGTGTVTGVHTYDNALKLNDRALERTIDETNTVEFNHDGVVIAKDLLVMGNLITPGFPPIGPSTPLPPDPTFRTVRITSGLLSTGDLQSGARVSGRTVLANEELIVGQRMEVNDGFTMGTENKNSMLFYEDLLTALGQ